MRHTLPSLLVNIALLALWAALFAPILRWYGSVLSIADARVNLLVLGGLLALVAALSLRGASWRAMRHRDEPVDPLAVATAVGGSVAYAAVTHWLRLNAVAGVCCGVATYGLAGLFLTRAAFRAGWPVAALAMLLLPMGGHMDTYLGFPLRLMTAELVQRVLAPAAAGAVQQETIILFENAAAHVDLPCSGVRSLWSGLMFFCAASWLTRASISPRWIAKAAVFVAVLLGANFLRVLALSALALFAKDKTAAAIVHAPLGILGFMAACALAYRMLRSAGGEATRRGPPVSEAARLRRPGLAPHLSAAAALAFLATLPAPAAIEAPAPAELVFTPPAGLSLTPAALSDVERRFLDGNGAHYTRKWRFSWRDGQSGSLLIVAARSWRAHHPPEQCLAGAGLPLSRLDTVMIDTGFPLRVVSLARAGGSAPRATYWYQSASRRTDDHAARVWDSLRGERTWLMVSLLFNSDLAVGSDELRALHTELSAAAQRLLPTGG